VILSFDSLGNNLKVQAFDKLIMAVVIAASSGFTVISRMNERSILSLRPGNCLK